METWMVLIQTPVEVTLAQEAIIDDGHDNSVQDCYE